MFTLTTPVKQTSGRCITQLAKRRVDPKFIELTADVFGGLFFELTIEASFTRQ